MSRAFFSTVRKKKNPIYASDYLECERQKFVCAVNVWSRAVL